MRKEFSVNQELPYELKEQLKNDTTPLDPEYVMSIYNEVGSLKKCGEIVGRTHEGVRQILIKAGLYKKLTYHRMVK